MPNTHEITIALVKDQDGEHAIPRIPDPGAMHVGDTVHYVSSDSELRVEFPLEQSKANDGTPCQGGSPFKGGTLTVWASNSLSHPKAPDLFSRPSVAIPSGILIIRYSTSEAELTGELGCRTLLSNGN